MIRKRAFYQKYGVDEFYILDPETNTVEGWLRRGANLEPITEINGWRSPRLGVSFHFDKTHLELRHPDGRPFAEGWESMRRADQEAERARRESERAHRLAAKLRALGVDKPHAANSAMALLISTFSHLRGVADAERSAVGCTWALTAPCGPSNLLT